MVHNVCLYVLHEHAQHTVYHVAATANVVCTDKNREGLI